ncbi:dienelactone hydrolase family protein [uncultured Roseobacter sp.]|uniref:dienelactone hydrolase family protein n=1 Tax=uncultured Roseobacter sp. TaxID=114847 RepID=UPI002616EC4A|nr:dienelactone hydrolase family protein [uncultured Roseobacter sp.]
MMKLLARISAVLILLAGEGDAQDSVFVGNVPLPEDVVVSTQAEGAFAGTWVGRWDNRRNHILVVERLGDDGLADVVYAVGSDLNGRGRWFRRKARIDGDTLVFADDSFAARYSLSSTGRIRGVFANNKGFAILQRQQLSALISSPENDWFSVGAVERLETRLVEDGHDIALSVVIYRPEGPGPFPLALVHHGSTGTGKNASDFDQIWTPDWLADVLNEHGWLAAFPQRRGRGLSDGLYDEGFAEDRSEGYSPKAELSLPGAERALEDANAALDALRKRADVSPTQTLVGGVSRGGVVAIMQAGDRPDEIAGVINFVGGWVGEGWGDDIINPTLFRRIGTFGGPVLSIYGEEDPFYSVEHSKQNLAQMEALGASTQLHVVKVDGYGNGHWAVAVPNLWEEVVDAFLRTID